MKKILFKVLSLVLGKFLTKRFGYSGGYDPYYRGSYYREGYDPYYRGGFFPSYKYKKQKSKLKKLKDLFD